MESQRWKEQQKEEKSEGLFYMGIAQGLLLGIGGNLVVAYSMGVWKGIVAPGWWFHTNLIGFIVGFYDSFFIFLYSD